jgi:hypothetical protein
MKLEDKIIPHTRREIIKSLGSNGGSDRFLFVIEGA